VRTVLLLLVALLLDAFCVLWVLDCPSLDCSCPGPTCADEAAWSVPPPLPEGAGPDFGPNMGSGNELPGGAFATVRAETAPGPISATRPVLVGVETWRSLAALAQALAEVPSSDGNHAGRANGVLDLLDAAVSAAQNRSADERIYFASWIESNPSFEELRADRRFLSLLERLVGPVVGGGLI